MEERLKHRLVGATVIVALVVIFVPEYFDEPRPTGDAQPLQLPQDTLGHVEHTSPDPTATESLYPLGEAEDQAKSTPYQGETANLATEGVADFDTPIKPIPRIRPSLVVGRGEESVGLSVWAVQLGAFSEPANAIGLRDRLREEGYAAFVQTVSLADQTLTRVYVGPELFREQAESIRKRLSNETTLNAMVVRYPND